jgi:threonine dehydrogenase-like Zn-dependent dehydrogenase
MFGYSHFTGGFAGGQAEYVRVPYGDVNLLKIPSNVPDEKALYLSDVLATSWNCVVDTGVQKGDVVAIWGAGPIGQMCCDFAFINGASRVIMIDSNWRLDYVKEKYPKAETLDYSTISSGESVTSKLKEMVDGRGPDVALECVAGEYPKGWAHFFELLTGTETDTSEIVNEMITSVRNYGRCGITGVYVGFTNHFNIGSLSTFISSSPPPSLSLFPTPNMLVMCSDENSGAWHPPNRQWSSTSPEILGTAPQNDPIR